MNMKKIVVVFICFFMSWYKPDVSCILQKIYWLMHWKLCQLCFLSRVNFKFLISLVCRWAHIFYVQSRFLLVVASPIISWELACGNIILGRSMAWILNLAWRLLCVNLGILFVSLFLPWKTGFIPCSCLGFSEDSNKWKNVAINIKIWSEN